MSDPAPLLIRRYRPDDHAALVELNAYGLAAAGIRPQDDAYGGSDFTDFAGTYLTARAVMLVGEVDHSLVAMGGLRRLNEATAEILRMRVQPDHQGRGYGRAVLQALEDQARNYGYTRIRLLTGVEQHPAIDLYRSAGYTEVRRVRLSGFDSVYLEKQLDGHLPAAPGVEP